MKIDTHAHVFTKALPMALGRRYTPGYDANWQDYLATMQPFGIQKAVLIQPSFLGEDNHFLLQTLQQVPQHFRGVVVVDPSISHEELIALHRQGVVGVRVNLIGRPLPDVTRGSWPTFLRRLIALDWVLELHALAQDLMVFLPFILPTGIKVVIAHCGRFDPHLGVQDPGFAYLLKAGAQSKRVWVKLSGFYRNVQYGIGETVATMVFQALRHAFGIERLLWGSDWPHTRYEHMVTFADCWQLFHSFCSDPIEREQILCHNPCALFRFGQEYISSIK